MRNQGYEQALDKQGVTYAYVEAIPLSEIDAKKGLQNQARLDTPLDGELVSAYEARYRAGEDAPPLVLHKPPRSKHVPLDGNQRLAAAIKAGRKSHDAYVVTSEDPKVIDRLAWSFNNHVNGKRLTAEEAMQHALAFVRKYGATTKEAADEWGVNVYTLVAAVKAAELRDVLRRRGVPNADGLPDAKVVRLQAMHTLGEDLFTMAAGATIRNGLTEKDLDDLTAEVRRAPTSEAKKKVVLEYSDGEKGRARRAETKGGSVRVKTPAPRDRLARLLRDAVRLFEDYSEKSALRPAGSAYRQAREDALDLVDRLTVLFGLGARPKEKVS